MFQIKTKRGLSTIVAAVLLIMLTVTAATILIRFLQPFVRNNLTENSECIPFQDYYQFQQTFENATGSYSFNCYQQSNGQTYIATMIKAGQNASQEDMENLNGFTIVFGNSGGEAEPVILTNGKTVTFNIGGIWRIDDAGNSILEINKPRETLTYIYHANKIYNTAEVYPILKDGRTCEKSDTITLKQCDGVTIS